MILHGDSLEVLRTLDANSVDAVVTDPPYGLAFMGKRWDYDVPSVELWREVLRVMKPGAHLLSFGGTRTYHRMVVNVEDAGFEVRDAILWHYGSGFPKSKSFRTIGKPELGTALKPATEIICLARKPISEKNLDANLLRWGTGALNVDASRIATTDTWQRKEAPAESAVMVPDNVNPDSRANVMYRHKTAAQMPAQGRWPANCIFDEAAAEALDQMSGVAKPKAERTGKRGGKDWHPGFDKSANPIGTWPADPGGGASRFFYVAKASRAERNKGLEGMPLMDAPGSKRSTPAEGRSSALGEPRANGHPTVKPIKLMEYLVRMVTPPGGLVLDPFAGSGSTGVAAVRLGFKFIGIEREAEYCEIARKRLECA